MAWSYSGNPGASNLDEVRFLIQDTDTDDQLLSDAEINYLLTQWTFDSVVDAYSTAIAAVGILIAKASRAVEESKKVGDLSLNVKTNVRLSQWQTLQKTLQADRFRHSPAAPAYNTNAFLPTKTGFVEGESTDFYVGQMDNKT